MAQKKLETEACAVACTNASVRINQKILTSEKGRTEISRLLSLLINVLKTTNDNYSVYKTSQSIILYKKEQNCIKMLRLKRPKNPT